MLLEVESSPSEKSDGEEESDEAMEDIEDEDENMGSAQMDTTGKYFDEGVMEDFIDIAPEDDEEEEGDQETKKGNKKVKQSAIKGTEAIKPKGKR